MTTTTMTFHHSSALDTLVYRASAIFARLGNAAADLLAAPTQREPRNAEELLEWAAQYEATQPSYAADLRAAALRHLN